MSVVKTAQIMPKLEAVIDFRLGEKVSARPKIVLQADNSCPATDGSQIFLPRAENRFKSKRDNEISLADSTAHETDHIREINEYFSAEINALRESGKPLAGEYLERNYSELTENPMLALYIDNIVKDRRIDAQRREKLPGSEKFHREALAPMMEYFRPSTKGMNELDAFRERYLQKALIGRVFEPIPEKQQKLLEEIVEITESAESINQDPEKVKQIYEIFKKNFDITQPISKLPPLFNRGEPTSGNPQGNPPSNYQKEIKPREGRNPDDKKPEKMNPDYDNAKPPQKVKPEESKTPKSDKNSKPKKSEYKTQDDSSKEDAKDIDSKDSRECGIEVIRYDSSEKLKGIDTSYFDNYAPEVESLKRIFRQLRLRNYGDKRAFEGQELDFEEHLQEDLEARAIGIRTSRKRFIYRTQNKQNPAFAIHADISGSTRGPVIDAIKASFYILGNALAVSEFDYGLYASDSEIYVLKSPNEKWRDDINQRIADLKAGGEGIYFRRTSEVIARHLQRTEGNPKCMVVISDFEVCDNTKTERKAVKELYDKKVYPLLIAIGEEHKAPAEYLTKDIGSEFYSVVSTDKLNELPGEVFRLFKTFGIAR